MALRALTQETIDFVERAAVRVTGRATTTASAATVFEILADHEPWSVTMLFDDDPPYALTGPWVPYVAVVLTACLATRRGLPATVQAMATSPTR